MGGDRRGVGRIRPDRPVEVGPPLGDRRISALAARQHGVVAAWQLAALGLARQTIADRVAAGRLHRVHRGVYAVGHPVLTGHGRWMAAVLAGGPRAVLSHRSAAALWGLLRDVSARSEISVPRSGGTHPGIRIHRPRSLPPDEATTRHGIPVTTPARTVLDLAAVLAPHRLERLLDQVEMEELTDYRVLRAMAAAHSGHHGAGKLMARLDEYDAGTALTKSDLERLFLTICRTNGLPTPLVNAYVGDDQVDFLFPAHRLIVEADSWRYHRTRQRFERDRRRDTAHTLAGYRTLRFTDRQLEREPRAVTETLSSALAERRAA